MDDNIIAAENYDLSLSQIKDYLLLCEDLVGSGQRISDESTYLKLNWIIDDLYPQRFLNDEIYGIYQQAVSLWSFANMGVLVKNIYPLVRRYRQHVHHSITMDETIEIIEDSRIQIFFASKTYDKNISKFTTYCTEVAINFARNFLRARYNKTRDDRADSYLEEIEKISGGQLDWDVVLPHQADLSTGDSHSHQLYEVINLEDIEKILDPNVFEIITLRYIDGLATDEVASRMGVTKNFVNYRLSKALKKIREFYSESPLNSEE